MNLGFGPENASLGSLPPCLHDRLKVKSDGSARRRVYDLWIMAAAVAGIVAYLMVRRYQDERP